MTARVVVPVILPLAVPACWHRPAVAILIRSVYVFFGPGALLSTGPPLLMLYHARRLSSHPCGLFCCHPPRRRTRVYVSYWYYKRPDIPSGVRRRPSGRDKTGGELFFSTHLDENKVQTLMGHCKVYDRPVWLDRGQKTAPMHTYYCSKVYDLQGQYVGGFAWGGGGRRVFPIVPCMCLLTFVFLLSFGSQLNDGRVSLVLFVELPSRSHRCAMLGATVTDAFVRGVVCCCPRSLHPPCLFLAAVFLNCSWLPPPSYFRSPHGYCLRTSFNGGNALAAQARRRRQKVPLHSRRGERR